jgi:hypothetical protein
MVRKSHFCSRDLGETHLGHIKNNESTHRIYQAGVIHTRVQNMCHGHSCTSDQTLGTCQAECHTHTNLRPGNHWQEIWQESSISSHRSCIEVILSFQSAHCERQLVKCTKVSLIWTMASIQNHLQERTLRYPPETRNSCKHPHFQPNSSEHHVKISWIIRSIALLYFWPEREPWGLRSWSSSFHIQMCPFSVTCKPKVVSWVTSPTWEETHLCFGYNKLKAFTFSTS